MKLLFDQNLSHKLVAVLADIYPNAAHVRELALQNAPDQEVWDFAKKDGYTIVSKDDDFHQLSFLYGPPPKVIWVKLGNCSTSDVAECLQRHQQAIRDFHGDPLAAFLAVS